MLAATDAVVNVALVNIQPARVRGINQRWRRVVCRATPSRVDANNINNSAVL